MYRKVQYALTVLITVFIYILLLPLAIDFGSKILSILRPWQEQLIVAVFALLVVQKLKNIWRFMRWRMERQVQGITFFYLAAATYVTSNYLFLTTHTNASVRNATVAFIISAISLGATLIYSLISYFVQEAEDTSDQRNRAELLDRPHAGPPLPSQVYAVTTLANLLKSQVNGVNGNLSLAIGIDGDWGDGKSSTIVMALNQDLTNQYIRVDFDPWRYTTQENMVSGFYDEIGKALEEKLPGFQMARVDMSKFAQNYIGQLDKTGVAKSLLQSTVKRPFQYSKKINEHLQKHNKRLLVVIEDVDRINDDSHVIRTLQLAQYLKSDIDRSVILFVAHTPKIEKAVAKRIREKFLQKIFDTTITVVPPTRQELIEYTNLQLNKLSPSYAVQLESENKLFELMRNFRGIKKVLSAFATDLDNIGNNVNAQDIFFLRAIYYAYPSLHLDIRENQDYYLQFDMETFGIYQILDDDFEELRKKHFEKLINELDLDESDMESLKAVLTTYFPALKNAFRSPGSTASYIDLSDMSRNRRIGIRDYLARYFILNESLDDRHKVEEKVEIFVVKQYLPANEKQRRKVLKQFIEKDENNNEVTYIAAIDVATSREKELKDTLGTFYGDLLRTYMELTGYLVRDNNSVLLRILHKINEDVPSQQYDSIFNSISRYMHHPSSGLRLLLYMNPRRNNNFYNLKNYPNYQDVRTKILRAVDRYYLTARNNVFEEDTSGNMEWRFILYQWALSVANDVNTDVDVDRKEKVNKYIQSIIKNNESLLHTFVMGTFWNRDLASDDFSFHFSDNMKPYDIEKIVSIVKNKLASTNKLNSKQIEELESFLSAYKQHQSQAEESNA